jgi:SAM-dependent methyltransferase
MPTSRITSEREFHDRQADARAQTLRAADYRFADDDYLEHESWIRPALAELGDVRGKRVLDLGCGHGMASVVLARRGARVVACDLSLGYLREARARSEHNAVALALSACDGARLPFADGAFEAIWGNAVLHHLDIAAAARELRRVLAPGGTAVLCEPWAGNPLLNLARRRLPYPGKQRTADEAPLAPPDLPPLRACFPAMRVQGHQLLGMLGRVVRHRRVRTPLAWCDRVLLGLFPNWQRYCRYVVLTLPRSD